MSGGVSVLGCAFRERIPRPRLFNDVPGSILEERRFRGGGRSAAEATEEIGGEPAADGERIEVVAQVDGVLLVGNTFDRGDVAGSDEGVAVDADDVGGEFFFEGL